MLIWMCALHCEAKPLIDFYKLKKSAGKEAYDLYQCDQMACIVSGIGEQKMAQAVDWGARLFASTDQPCWINLGIAGDKHLPIGSAVLASRVSQLDNTVHTHWYETSSPTTDHFISKPVTSLSCELSDYDETTLYDMEAAAFFRTAIHYSPAERCHSIKIISDNSENPAHRNKARISQLIADNMPAIAGYATQLIKSR